MTVSVEVKIEPSWWKVHECAADKWAAADCPRGRGPWFRIFSSYGEAAAFYAQLKADLREYGGLFPNQGVKESSSAEHEIWDEKKSRNHFVLR